MSGCAHINTHKHTDIQIFTHSLRHSLTHARTHALMHSFTHTDYPNMLGYIRDFYQTSLARSLPHSPTHSLTHADYPNLLGYIRDIYQTFESVRRATNMKHIKQHYFTSHPILNAYAIVPANNGPDLLAPHGRKYRGGSDNYILLLIIPVALAATLFLFSKKKN